MLKLLLTHKAIIIQYGKFHVTNKKSILNR